ncbi:hypothetical protein V2J09_011201 [Rumex salicifolius]
MATALSLSSTFYLYSTSSSRSRPFMHSNFSTCVERGSQFRCNAGKKIGFFDQILDYIEGGPKLRRWYGAPDLLPKDGSLEEEEGEIAMEEVRDAVLVTDGDSDIGQMVILSLIVKRARVKALVKDKRAAMEAFGNYVESLAGDANSNIYMKKALRGVRAIICPSEGFLSKVESFKGVQHIVVLSQLSVYEGAGGLLSLVNSNSRKLAEQDESVLLASGVPYTIIRAGSLINTPGGIKGFSFDQEPFPTLLIAIQVFGLLETAASGQLSKEDAAFICVEALDSVPQAGLKFEVANGEDKVSDWKQKFKELIEMAEKKEDDGSAQKLTVMFSSFKLPLSPTQRAMSLRGLRVHPLQDAMEVEGMVALPPNCSRRKGIEINWAVS